MSLYREDKVIVAPCAGAGIEICNAASALAAVTSPPARGRGLKCEWRVLSRVEGSRRPLRGGVD